MNSITAIDPRKHAELKLRADPGHAHARDHHLAPLTLPEFVFACHDYPIVFVKEADTGRFMAAALLGLRPKQNLFHDPSGWRATYVPECIRAHPFQLHPMPGGGDQMVLCVDERSPQLSATEGEPLFQPDGRPATWLQKTGERLASYQQRLQLTRECIQLLLEISLLVSRPLELKLPGETPWQLNGLYLIDEEKLNALADADFLHLRAKGLLMPIYAALLSQNRVRQLLAMQR